MQESQEREMRLAAYLPKESLKNKVLTKSYRHEF